MIVEKVDPVSGAVLFKKDKESKDLEYAMQKIEELTKVTESQDKRIKKLENRLKTLDEKSL